MRVSTSKGKLLGVSEASGFTRGEGAVDALSLDETDAKILRALQRDARFPLKEVAREARVSVPTVRARIKRLTDLGVIKGFTVYIDPKRLTGRVTAFVYLKARPESIDQIKKSLMDRDEITSIYHTAGEHQLTVKLEVPDIRVLEDFLVHTLTELPGVESYSSSLIVETAKELYGPVIHPGLGIAWTCAYCKKDISGEPARRTIDHHQYFFCCETCADAFEKIVTEKRQ